MKTLFVRVIFAITAAAVATVANAEDARVLPRGRSRISVIYAQTAEVSQTFNNDSRPESLTAAYNMDLSSVTIPKLVPEARSLVKWLNNTGWHYNVEKREDGSHGLTRSADFPALGDALSRGFLGVDARAVRQQTNFSYQYGVTDRLSVGAMLPYIKTKVSITHSVTGVNSANDAYYAIASPSGTNVSADLLQALDLIRSANDETLQSFLVSKGYARFADSDVSGLGDLVVGGRYCYLDVHTSGGDWINSVQAGVTVPTGRLKPTSEITQVDFGAGTWDIGIAHITNYTPISLITLSSGLHYTYRLWSKRLMRVKSGPTDYVPGAEDEEKVSQKLGDKISATLGATLNLSRALTLDTSYEWWLKRSDHFEGTRDRDYTYLSDATESYTETVQVGASLSSIPAFMKKDFPMPAQLSANLYLPVSGKNAAIAPYGTAELALYF